jgi:small-conductance mechanosensitive channel
VDAAKRIKELEHSNTELRAALIFAARRINQLRRNDRTLPFLREKLREARRVAKQKSD